MDAECPIAGCDYRAPIGSVEAHISGSTSGGHEGEVGRHHREDLRNRVEGALNGDDEADESPDGTETGDRSGGALDVAEATTSESEVPEVAGPAALAGGLSPITLMAILSVGTVLFLTYRASTLPAATETATDGGEPEALDRGEAGGLTG